MFTSHRFWAKVLIFSLLLNLMPFANIEVRADDPAIPKLKPEINATENNQFEWMAELATAYLSSEDDNFWTQMEPEDRTVALQLIKKGINDSREIGNYWSRFVDQKNLNAIDRKMIITAWNPEDLATNAANKDIKDLLNQIYAKALEVGADAVEVKTLLKTLKKSTKEIFQTKLKAQIETMLVNKQITNIDLKNAYYQLVDKGFKNIEFEVQTIKKSSVRKVSLVSKIDIEYSEEFIGYGLDWKELKIQMVTALVSSLVVNITKPFIKKAIEDSISQIVVTDASKAADYFFIMAKKAWAFDKYNKTEIQHFDFIKDYLGKSEQENGAKALLIAEELNNITGRSDTPTGRDWSFYFLGRSIFYLQTSSNPFYAFFSLRDLAGDTAAAVTSKIWEYIAKEIIEELVKKVVVGMGSKVVGGIVGAPSTAGILTVISAILLSWDIINLVKEFSSFKYTLFSIGVYPVMMENFIEGQYSGDFNKVYLPIRNENDLLLYDYSPHDQKTEINLLLRLTNNIFAKAISVKDIIVQTSELARADVDNETFPVLGDLFKTVSEIKGLCSLTCCYGQELSDKIDVSLLPPEMQEAMQEILPLLTFAALGKEECPHFNFITGALRKDQFHLVWKMEDQSNKQIFSVNQLKQGDKINMTLFENKLVSGTVVESTQKYQDTYLVRLESDYCQQNDIQCNIQTGNPIIFLISHPLSNHSFLVITYPGPLDTWPDLTYIYDMVAALSGANEYANTTIRPMRVYLDKGAIPIARDYLLRGTQATIRVLQIFDNQKQSINSEIFDHIVKSDSPVYPPGPYTPVPGPYTPAPGPYTPTDPDDPSYPTPTLLGEWKFSGDYESTKIYDTSGNEHNGKLLAYAKKNNEGVNGNSAYFRYAQDKAEVSSSDFYFNSNDVFSISAWIKSGTTERSTIVGQWKPSYNLAVDEGYLQWEIGGKIYKASQKLPGSSSGWHHVVGVYDGIKQEIIFYVNGQEIDRQNVSVEFEKEERPLEIGSAYGDLRNIIKIDEVRVYQGLLSESFIKAQYQNEKNNIFIDESKNPPVSVEGLIAEWRFDEESENEIIIDSSGMGHNGKISRGSAYRETNDCIENKCLIMDSDSFIYSHHEGLHLERNTPKTFSVWIKPTEFLENSMLLSYEDSFNIGLYQGRPYLETSDSVQRKYAKITAPKPLLLNEWNHLLLEHQNGDVLFYLNGEKIWEEYNSEITFDYDIKPFIYIGTVNSSISSVKGFIDTVSIYNRWLSGEEINTLYENKKPLPKLLPMEIKDIKNQKNGNAIEFENVYENLQPVLRFSFPGALRPEYMEKIGYTLQIDSDGIYDSGEANEGDLKNITIAPQAFTFGDIFEYNYSDELAEGAYYFRVRAENEYGATPWTDANDGRSAFHIKKQIWDASNFSIESNQGGSDPEKILDKKISESFSELATGESININMNLNPEDRIHDLWIYLETDQADTTLNIEQATGPASWQELLSNVPINNKGWVKLEDLNLKNSYLRISANKTIKIYEIVPFGGKNFALNDDFLSIDNGYYNLIDGNFSSYESTKINEGFVFDLVRPRTLFRINIYAEEEKTCSYKIQTSSNKNNWQTIIENEGNGFQSLKNINYSTRYLRIIPTKCLINNANSNLFEVKEIELFGTPPEIFPEEEHPEYLFYETFEGSNSRWIQDGKAEVVNDAYMGEKAMKMTYTSDTNSALAAKVGTLKSGKTYQAQVKYKAPIGHKALLFFGDSGGSDPYDNKQQVFGEGTGKWEDLSITHTMSHDDKMWVYVYGRGKKEEGNFAIYDEVKITMNPDYDLENNFQKLQENLQALQECSKTLSRPEKKQFLKQIKNLFTIFDVLKISKK